MKNNVFLILALVLTIAALGCTQQSQKKEEAQIANPASKFCEDKGYTLEIRTDEAEGQTGYCKFQDGSECEEWAYFRGECAPESEGFGP